MNIQQGSPWARAEEERDKSIAMKLAYESEQARNIPGKFIKSVKLAVESLSYHDTFEGDLALRRGMAQLPGCLAQLQHS